MELKCMNDGALSDSLERSNRTFMELKFKRIGVDASPHQF